MAAMQPTETNLTQTNQLQSTQMQPTQPNDNQQTEQAPLDYYYTNFKGTHIDGSEPKEKTLENANGKINYKEIPLQYNYGTPEAPIIDSCFFECPEVSSYGGIVCKRDTKPAAKEGDPPYIKESYSMMFTFNLQDKECVECLEKWDDLHKGTAQTLAKHKGKVGMYSFNPEHPGEIFKHPIYYKIDPVTCERVAGRNPSLWVKLNSWKNNKTLFTDINENVIDWALLTDVEVKMIPLIHVEKIYIGGGKASLQLKLHSAIVTDIVPIGTRSRQTATLDRLKNKKGLADQVASQLAQMRMERQDALDGGAVQPQNATLPGSEVGGMHQIPSSDNTQENLSAYLGGAPSMNSSPPVQTQPVPPVQTQSVPSVSQTQSVPVQPTQPQLNVQSGATQPPQQVQQTVSETQSQTQNQPVQFNAQASQPVLQIQ